MPSSPVPSARAVVAGVGGGLAHLALVFSLWGAFGVTPSTADPVAATAAVYLLAGAVLVGALPVVLLVDRRLVAPAVAVAGVLVFSAYRTWRLVESPAALPRWFDLYVAGWPAVLAVVVVLAVAECSLRRAERETG